MTDQRLVGDWMVTILSSFFFKNEVFGKNKTIFVQNAIMIIYKINLFRLSQNRTLHL